MPDCKVDHTDPKNNGLITKIWGGPGWIFNHAVTFGYPVKPTLEQKTAYKNYFITLGDVLPCRFCRESYKKFITTGKTALTDQVLESRDNLTLWFYHIHQAVNEKLEVDYNVSYKDVVDRYESFRAKCSKSINAKGCVAPLDYKAFSFKKLYYTDAPIVPLDLCSKFKNLALKRGLDEKKLEFFKLATILNGDYDLLKAQKCWPWRNIYCSDLIKEMRINAIPSIETEGPWKGTPTIQELTLLMFMSSNLSYTELVDLVSIVEILIN